jgi:hypothetical protein
MGHYFGLRAKSLTVSEEKAKAEKKSERQRETARNGWWKNGKRKTTS